MKKYAKALWFMLVSSMSAMAGAIIPSGATLVAGQYAISNNGNFAFGVDAASGKLYFHYRFPTQAWGASAMSQMYGTQPEGALYVGKGDRLVMQTDGRLVFYSGNDVVWSNWYYGPAPIPGSYAVVEDFGVVAIYPPQGGYPTFTWPFASVTPNSGALATVVGYPFGVNFPVLNGRQWLQIFNNVTYYLWNKSFAADSVAMQTDGNLVVYNKGQPVWSTGTSGNPGAYMLVTPVGFVLGKQYGGILANVPYPVSVDQSSRASGPNDPKPTPAAPPPPSLNLPINASWKCYYVKDWLACYAPG